MKNPGSPHVLATRRAPRGAARATQPPPTTASGLRVLPGGSIGVARRWHRARHDGWPTSALEEAGQRRLLTPEDVAELLQVDRETIYRMARRGELPAIKVARHWRFRAARIERWLRDLEKRGR